MVGHPGAPSVFSNHISFPPLLDVTTTQMFLMIIPSFLHSFTIQFWNPWMVYFSFACFLPLNRWNWAVCILLCLISFALHCFVKFIHVIAAYFSVLNSTPLYNIPQFIYFVVLCFCFWLCWVFVTSQGLSLVAVSGSYCSLRCAGLSCCVAWALGCVSVSSCITGAQ